MKVIKAKKDHRCDDCYKKISIGTYYLQIAYDNFTRSGKYLYCKTCGLSKLVDTICILGNTNAV